MNVVEGLQQMGLSEYESRAYAALVAHPGVTGYEVAKFSGVPRAKIYDALQGLVEKGAAVTSQEGERVLHHPVPHATFVKRYRERTDRVAEEVEGALNALAQQAPEEPLLTLRGSAAMLARAREIIGAAQQKVFVLGWPASLPALIPDLVAAEARGTEVYVMVYGELDMPLRNVFFHPLPDPRSRMTALPEAFIVVGDHAEVLMGEMAGRTVGLYTRNEAIVLVAAEFIRHDIMLLEMGRHFGPAFQTNEGAREANRRLQSMWYVKGEEK